MGNKDKSRELLQQIAGLPETYAFDGTMTLDQVHTNITSCLKRILPLDKKLDDISKWFSGEEDLDEDGKKKQKGNKWASVAATMAAHAVLSEAAKTDNMQLTISLTYARLALSAHNAGMSPELVQYFANMTELHSIMVENEARENERVEAIYQELQEEDDSVFKKSDDEDFLLGLDEYLNTLQNSLSEIIDQLLDKENSVSEDTGAPRNEDKIDFLKKHKEKHQKLKLKPEGESAEEKINRLKDTIKYEMKLRRKCELYDKIYELENKLDFSHDKTAYAKKEGDHRTKTERMESYVLELENKLQEKNKTIDLLHSDGQQVHFDPAYGRGFSGNQTNKDKSGEHKTPMVDEKKEKKKTAPKLAPPGDPNQT